ncbi:methionine ABC transporter ATP-binding protein [Deinococcus yavapaiensis]|uniref:D-methionine transport system ATP-binding protein n=1 Tax=Deinococcus yavapaiensis KR-236 TaxID=694435 RepID=A0A318S6A7_9DEIO|nr:methionine ABC transporter ATP-binding protein [Deinococcus yavapaiensis]PYE53257.1 D-methionine transport system ATP-binding protein [Deinococcus yavapaiensis KR-236]
MIEFQHVHKTYEGGHVALQDLSLEVKAGSAFGIIGESGAGKSTVTRLISGLEVPSSGEVRVLGQNLAALAGRERRAVQSKIGMVFQHFNLLAQRTAAGNVALPLELAGVPKKKRDARVREVLDLVGLSAFAERYPAQLSGGQKQRVGIARALALEPRLLIADEATSALDPATSASILRLLRDVQTKTGLTLVIVTHQMEVVRAACTHVAVMERGVLVESGEANEVLRRPAHAATRALLNAHKPDVTLAPHETLARVTIEGGLGTEVLARLAASKVRVVSVEPIEGAADVWLALPEGVNERAVLGVEVAA